MCLFKINFYIYLVYACMCVCARTCINVYTCIWDPACHSACVEVKRQLKELIFSFNHVLGLELRSTGMGAVTFTSGAILLLYLTTFKFYFFYK